MTNTTPPALRIYERIGKSGNPDDIPETECAWAAGLIDGEGSFTYHGGPGKNSLRIQVYNTEITLLERCQKVIGGRISEIRRNIKPVHWKRSYVLSITRWEDQQRALALIIPYLSQPKTSQVNRVLARMDDFRQDPSHRSEPHTHLP